MKNVSNDIVNDESGFELGPIMYFIQSDLELLEMQGRLNPAYACGLEIFHWIKEQHAAATAAQEYSEKFTVAREEFRLNAETLTSAIGLQKAALVESREHFSKHREIVKSGGDRNNEHTQNAVKAIKEQLKHMDDMRTACMEILKIGVSLLPPDHPLHKKALKLRARLET
jgi:hypothetical protein